MNDIEKLKMHWELNLIEGLQYRLYVLSLCTPKKGSLHDACLFAFCCGLVNVHPIFDNAVRKGTCVTIYSQLCKRANEIRCELGMPETECGH